MTTFLDIIAKTTGAYLESKTTIREFRQDSIVEHVENVGMISGAVFLAGLTLFVLWFFFGFDGLAALFQLFFWIVFMVGLLIACFFVAVFGFAKEADALIKLAHKYSKEELGKK